MRAAFRRNCIEMPLLQHMFSGGEAAAGLLLCAGHRAMTMLLMNWKESKNGSKKQHGLGKTKRN